MGNPNLSFNGDTTLCSKSAVSYLFQFHSRNFKQYHGKYSKNLLGLTDFFIRRKRFNGPMFENGQETNHLPWYFRSLRTIELASLGLDLGWPCLEMTGQIQTQSRIILAIQDKGEFFHNGCKVLHKSGRESRNIFESRMWSIE